MTSIYRWEENVEVASEQLLIIKTTRFNYPQLEITIRNAHSYQVPEIIAIPVVAGSTDYLSWLEDSVRSGNLLQTP
jgi:periplasmic divalent cation tolerance protein